MFNRMTLIHMLWWAVCIVHIATVHIVARAQYLMPEIEFEPKGFPLAAFAAMSAANNHGGGGGGGGAANLAAIGSPLLSFNDAFNTLAGLSQLAQLRNYGSGGGISGLGGQPLLTGDVFSGSIGLLPAFTEPLMNNRQPQPYQHLEQRTELAAAPSCMSGPQTANNNAQEAHVAASPMTVDPKQQFEVLPSSGSGTSNLAAKYVAGIPPPSATSGAENRGQHNPSSSSAMKVLTAIQHDPSASLSRAAQNKISNALSNDFMTKLLRLAKTIRQTSEVGGY